MQSYSEAELLELSNLIALIFRLDRVDDLEEILETFVKFFSVINKLTPEEFNLFMAWAIQVLPGSFPEENKKEIIRVLKEAHPKEVETLISNVERAVKKSLDDAQKKGIEKGIEKGIQKVAKQMLTEGEAIDKIMRYTGLAREEIERLR